jgi:hypothetical protein
VDFAAEPGKDVGMDNASDVDLKQLVEDPEDAPLVEAAGDEHAQDEKQPAPPSGADE